VLYRAARLYNPACKQEGGGGGGGGKFGAGAGPAESISSLAIIYTVASITIPSLAGSAVCDGLTLGRWLNLKA